MIPALLMRTFSSGPRLDQRKKLCVTSSFLLLVVVPSLLVEMPLATSGLKE